MAKRAMKGTFRDRLKGPWWYWRRIANRLKRKKEAEQVGNGSII